MCNENISFVYLIGRSYRPGTLVHAIAEGRTALCGRTYGKRSGGWAVAEGATEPSCKKCASKLKKLKEKTHEVR